MLGRQDRQMAIVFMDMESLIPENHLFYCGKLTGSYPSSSYTTCLHHIIPLSGVHLWIPSVCSRCFWWAIYMASNQNAGWRRKCGSISLTVGFAVLSWMRQFRITPLSAKPEHANGSKAIFSKKCFRKL